MVLPLAPLAEQHRIVAKIEELVSELDAGVELLKKLKAKLKRYRQAVLKAAVEGKLTKDWREAHQGELEPASVLLERILKERREKWEAEQLAQMKAKGKTPKDDSWKLKYKEPVAPDTSDLPELPKGWVWANIEIIGEVSGGLTKNSKRDKLPLKMPYLRVANVYADSLQLDDVKQIGINQAEIDRVLLEKGDLLVVEGNGSIDQIGRVALWDGSISPCLHQNHLIKVRFQLIEIAKYVLLWLLSVDGRKQITRVASSTSGLHTLSLSKVAVLPVPLPPLTEQPKIVEAVERFLSVIDELEKVINQNLKRAEKLRQSILKKAFEGKLVPQDPTDEPADKLLERIKAEKAKREAEAKAKKKQKQPGKSQQLELF
jgi:type I restriction enzyme S subunit